MPSSEPDFQALALSYVSPAPNDISWESRSFLLSYQMNTAGTHLGCDRPGSKVGHPEFLALERLCCPHLDLDKVLEDASFLPSRFLVKTVVPLVPKVAL